MSTIHIVQRIDEDSNVVMCEGELIKQGIIVGNKAYMDYAAALEVAIGYAEHLCAEMIDADMDDPCYDEPRDWRVEFHDNGANVFDGEELAWRIEVVELTVVK